MKFDGTFTRLELNQVQLDEQQLPDGNYAAVIATAEAYGADSVVRGRNWN